MSSLGILMEIGKSGLKSYQYDINVSSHNIANMQTEGYSRQVAVQVTKPTVVLGGNIYGQGSEIGLVERSIDEIINKRLDEHRADYAMYEELENSMQTFEGLFSEAGVDSETSLSTMYSEFANAWQSLANNPSGASERVTLYEISVSLTEQLRILDTDLKEIQIDLTRTIEESVNDINLITHEIAVTNSKLYGLEADTVLANDLRDSRDNLITQLYEYMDVTTYEQENGFITVTGANGSVLVNGTDSYELAMIGDQKTGLGQVAWLNSAGDLIDITDGITSGKIGGWLEMRDEIIGDGTTDGFRKDFNDLALDLIWAVNTQHSQGVGLELFQPNTTLTGSYYTMDDNASIGSLTYALGDYVDFGTAKSGDVAAITTGFDIYIGDSDGENLQKVTIQLANFDTIGTEDVELFTVDTTTYELADSINKQIEAALGKPIDECGLQIIVPEPEEILENAGAVDAETLLDGEDLPEDEEAVQEILENVTTLKFEADSTITFGFSNDTSNILAAYGINTFF